MAIPDKILEFWPEVPQKFEAGLETPFRVRFLYRSPRTHCSSRWCISSSIYEQRIIQSDRLRIASRMCHIFFVNLPNLNRDWIPPPPSLQVGNQANVDYLDDHLSVKHTNNKSALQPFLNFLKSDHSQAGDSGYL